MRKENEIPSLRDIAFQLCKRILECDFRESVKNILGQINRNGSGRNEYTQEMRDLGLQLGSYLIIDQFPELIKIPRQKGTFLTDNERQVFLKIHGLLSAIDREFLNALERSDLTDALIAVNPYGVFNSRLPITVDEPELIFPVEIKQLRDRLSAPNRALYFATHNHGGGKIDSNNYCLEVTKLEEALFNSVQKSPDLIEKIMRTGSDSDKAHLLHISGLVTFKDSISNLNQMLFQALTLDRIPRLSENQVVEVLGGGGLVHHRCGKSILLEYIPPEWYFKNTIVYLDLPSFRISGLYRVERDGFDFSVYGMYAQVALREIDQDLTRFNSLLNYF
jgi:hypothetical protein